MSLARLFVCLSVCVCLSIYGLLTQKQKANRMLFISRVLLVYYA